MRKPVSTLVACLLSLVSLGHLCRLVLRIEVTAAGIAMPFWISVFGCVVPATLAVLLWRESRR